MSKTIRISDEAYERLKSWKKDGESFSHLIIKIIPRFRTADEVMAELDRRRKFTEEETERLLKAAKE